MRNAEAATADIAARLGAELFGMRGSLNPREVYAAGTELRTAAIRATRPILGALTDDAAMVDLIAMGMAEEAVRRLRKRGAA
jgi:hypothetical protein